MKVSIVMPCYVKDEECNEHFIKCLAALKKNTKSGDYQLIVIDNGSNFSTDLMKQEADIYIRKEKALGWAKAINLGIMMADEEMLVLFDNDMYIPEDWLPKMLEVYQGHNGVLMPNTQTLPERIQQNKTWGALMLLPRKIFTEVGYFDEILNYRYPDQDFWIRAKKKGFEIMRTGAVVVEHPVDGLTFHKMGVEEIELKERDEMFRRHGASTYEDWIKL